MNPIYEQLCSDEDKKYADAIDKFVDADKAFQKLTSEQQKRFCNDVYLYKIIQIILNQQR